MTFYVKGFKSKKNTPCVALVADLGYKRKYVSFDKYLCAELADVTLRDLMDRNFDEGFEIVIGKGV